MWPFGRLKHTAPASLVCGLLFGDFLAAYLADLLFAARHRRDGIAAISAAAAS
jgi:hypothetical protein